MGRGRRNDAIGLFLERRVLFTEGQTDRPDWQTEDTNQGSTKKRIEVGGKGMETKINTRLERRRKTDEDKPF